MDQNEFVEAIKITVLKSAVQSVESVLIKPPGRQPNVKTLKLSAWYNDLNEGDKQKVQEVIQETAEMAEFGFFCVLDGVRTIEDSPEKGRLKLYFEKNGRQVLLNDPDDDYLHDLLNAGDGC